MYSKSKSSLCEPSNNKASPATPRCIKVSRGVAKSDVDSPSSLQNPRVSVDRSPRSVTSKPTICRRSPKLATPPDKQPTHVLKVTEIQAQLGLVQEDLKNTKEKLVLVEKEKAHATEELKEAHRLSEEANEKLREALVAQKRAEENSEIEKFRAVEMEQAGIEVAQKKEEESQKELEAVRNQHALDVATLLFTTQELQRVKHELSMTCDAKNQALIHADDATKIAEIHVEKVEILSAELVRLKSMLDSKFELEANENTKLMSQLNLEIETLKHELEKFRNYEEKLLEKEASIEHLNVKLEAMKIIESYARNLVEEWQKKVEDLEIQVEEAKQMERSASESLESVMKQLEGSNDLLQDAESEIGSLTEKAVLLDISIGRQRRDLEESERLLDTAMEEAAEMARRVDCLNLELQTVKEEKTQALTNEKLAAVSVQTLLEEKNKLINELDCSRDEEEKNKKAMESLAAALNEVSTESREAKEKLLSSQADNEIHVAEIEDLRLALKASKTKYEMKLDDAKHELDSLSNSIEQSKHKYQISKTEWDKKELYLMNFVKQSEDENSLMEKEIIRLENLLKEAQGEACSTEDERAQLQNAIKEAESEVIYLQELLGGAKVESMSLKESLMDKESELQCVVMENDEFRTREAVSLKKIEELSKLLEDATPQKQAEENGEISDSENDYDMLPKVVEFSDQNGDCRENKLEVDLPSHEEAVKETHQMEKSNLHGVEFQTDTAKVASLNGNPKNSNNKEKQEEEDSVDVDLKMWDSCKIGDKDLSPERENEHESFEDLDSKVEGVEISDQENGFSADNMGNGGSSPSKQQYQKKKKALLRKFGSLLKKKSSNNQK